MLHVLLPGIGAGTYAPRSLVPVANSPPELARSLRPGAAVPNLGRMTICASSVGRRASIAFQRTGVIRAVAVPGLNLLVRMPIYAAVRFSGRRAHPRRCLVSSVDGE